MAARRKGTQAAAYQLLCSATPGGTAELESAVRRHTRPWRRTLEKSWTNGEGYMDYNSVSVKRNVTGCGNRREEGKKKKAEGTSKAEEAKNSVGEARSGK